MTSYTYKGTKITGTSKSGKAFPASDVKVAALNQTYLNTTTGHVYKCVDVGTDTMESYKVKEGGKTVTKQRVKVAKGTPTKAKWAYVLTPVRKKPSSKVSSLSVKRRGGGSHVVEAAWKVPAGLVDDENQARAQRLVVIWSVLESRYGKQDWRPVKTALLGTGSASSSLDLNSARGNRGGYYPGSDVRLLAAKVEVVSANSVGQGATAAKSLEFKSPRAPEVAVPEFDASTGLITCSVATDAGEDARERRDTRYQVHVTDKAKKYKGYHRDASSGAADIPVSYDAKGYQALDDGQYIAVKVRAWARGYAGDSAKAGWKTCYVSRPKKPSLKAPQATSATAAGTDNGLVKCPVSISRPEGFPVTGVRLQALVNTTCPTAAQAAVADGWADVEGAVDNGSCTCLTARAGQLRPSTRGRRTYVRVKAWNHAEVDALSQYSNVVEVPLRLPEAAGDNACAITAGAPNADGTSATVVVAWDKPAYAGDDDTTSMQLAWSDDAGALKSTAPPAPFDIGWDDGSPHASARGSWASSATVKVKGLEPETQYWFWARCVVDGDGGAAYGAWCPAFPVKTATVPEGDADSGLDEAAVALSAPAVVAAGEGVPLTWTVAANGEQSSWELFNSSVSSIMGRDGAEGSCVLPASRVAELSAGGSLEVAVRVYVGGGYVESAPVAVAVADPPALMLAVADLAAQPFSFTAESDVPGCGLSFTVTAADGVSDEGPAGGGRQVEGDTVGYGSLTPAWEPVAWADSLRFAALEAQALAAEEAGDVDAKAAAEAAMEAGGAAYQAAVSLAPGLDFRDGASYRLDAALSDPSTSLSSAAVSAEFGVSWAHRAPAPAVESYRATSDAAVDPAKAYYERAGEGTADDPYTYLEVADPSDEGLPGYFERDDGVTLEPYDVTDGEGARRMGCTLGLRPPAGALATDVYDVYRLTHDGVELIGSGLALDAEVSDDYAPFGDAGDYGYRVCTRTADGDLSWADYGYQQDGSILRLDWGGSYVELPYDVLVSDSFEKDVEVRTHMDGVSEAFWNEGARRKASLSTNVLRIEDAAKAAAVRELAQFAGPVFVRTPDGSAYCADVQVKAMDVGRGAVAVALDAQQVSAGGRFALTQGGD